jgi:hypothetical protein
MNSVQAQDEILQMMFWMRGENLGDPVTIDQLHRFLDIELDALHNALRQLVARGLVSMSGACYGLTARGGDEGGRRFIDEFSGVLGKEDHLSCNDPDCDCQSPEFRGRCQTLEARPS